MRRLGGLFDPLEPVGITPFDVGSSSPSTAMLDVGVPAPVTPFFGATPGDGSARFGGGTDRPSAFGLDVDPFAPLRAFGAKAGSGSPFDALTNGFLDARRENPFDKLIDGMSAWGGGAASGFGQAVGGGSVSAVGGQWATLDQHNAEFASAEARLGVPGNLLKSMVNRESSGNWGPGYDQSYGGFRNDDILPFVGIFRQTADAWGLDYDAMIGDKQAQIDGMATIMKGLSDQYGGYENAVKVYFGGEAALNGGFTDELGMDSGTYGTKAINDWKQLDAMGTSNGYKSPAPGTSGWGEVGSLWGGAKVEDWGEFNVESGNGLYGYASAYGLSGTTHTGLDVVGDIGTRYTSPVSGTVTCAGTGNGSGADGGGCSAFNDVMGNGAGRVEVQLDNGAVLIFGHSSDSFVRPGQRVNAGDALGTVGGMNSAHVHLEARVRDSSTPSGWRIVDPRTVMGGGGGGAAAQAGQQVQQTGSSFADAMRRALFS